MQCQQKGGGIKPRVKCSECVSIYTSAVMVHLVQYGGESVRALLRNKQYCLLGKERVTICKFEGKPCE
jgi:hypothetical protein